MTKSLPRGKALEVMDELYPPAAGDRSRSGVFREVDVSLIEANPFQPRRNFDPAELANLAESIYQDGQAQPIGLRKHPERKGRYQIIWGERRWRAVTAHGAVNKLRTLDAMVREATDEEMADLAIIENIQRQPLTPAEEVAYVRTLQQRGHNDTQIAKRLNQSVDWVRLRSPLVDLKDDVAWMLDYPESLTYAKETNRLTGRLRSTVIAFVRSRVKGAGKKLDLSVSEFRAFIEARGGSAPALRTTPAPGPGVPRALPAYTLPEKARKARKRYEWEEDEAPSLDFDAAPSAPSVNESAVPHTVGRVRHEALLLEGYARQFSESGKWSDAQREEMCAAIGEAVDALEVARELLQGAG